VRERLAGLSIETSEPFSRTAFSFAAAAFMELELYSKPLFPGSAGVTPAYGTSTQLTLDS
jgi:hypothetical protein